MIILRHGITSFVYKGYFIDEETNFYSLNSRYYHPEIHRFISPDSFEYIDESGFSGLDLYAYCLNNPIMYADLSGLSAILIGLIISAVVGVGIGYIAPQIGSALSSFTEQKFTLSARTYYTASGELTMTAGLTITKA